MSDKNGNKYNNVEIGALWNRTGKTNNKQFFSGNIRIKAAKLEQLLNEAKNDEYGKSNLQITVFENDFKEKDNHPDWKMFYSDDNPQAKSSSKASAKTSKSAPKPNLEDQSEVEDEDLPI